MGRILSKMACLALAVTILFGGLSLFPSWSAAVGLDVWDLPAWVDALQRGQRENERLDREVRAAVQRTNAKHVVGCQLVAGRLTLLEAAARLRDIEASAPERPQQPPPFTVPAEFRRTGSDEERFCCWALAWAERASPAASGASDDRIRALRDELRDRLRRGDLRLPPLAPQRCKERS